MDQEGSEINSRVAGVSTREGSSGHTQPHPHPANGEGMHETQTVLKLDASWPARRTRCLWSKNRSAAGGLVKGAPASRPRAEGWDSQPRPQGTEVLGGEQKAPLQRGLSSSADWGGFVFSQAVHGGVGVRRRATADRSL